MPRSQQSAAGKIVEFFRGVPLETAELVLGLCKDAVGERKQKSRDAKARALQGPAPAAAPAKTVGKKKTAKKRKARKLRDQPLPLTMPSNAEYSDIGADADVAASAD